MWVVLGFFHKLALCKCVLTHNAQKTIYKSGFCSAAFRILVLIKNLQRKSKQVVQMTWDTVPFGPWQLSKACTACTLKGSSVFESFLSYCHLSKVQSYFRESLSNLGNFSRK